MLACVKHFALYGAPMGGRDYNTVDMSRRAMEETYFPPYRAAIDAGARTVMTSFNEIDGIPASGNRWLLTELLRERVGIPRLDRDRLHVGDGNEKPRHGGDGCGRGEAVARRRGGHGHGFGSISSGSCRTW